MAITSTELKKQILASKISHVRSLNLEKALEYDLNSFFKSLKEKVIHELKEYWPDNEGVLLQGQLDLILAPIFESQQEYYNILREYNVKEYDSGYKQGRRLVNLARKPLSSFKSESNTIKVNKLANLKVDKDELFGTNDWTQQKLLDQSFTASENTMNRVDSDINKIISDGYKSGHGINKVAANIENRFQQLQTWESKRIARTEIHNAHQMGIMNIYQEMGVQYTQWTSAHDSRVRGHKPKDKANHVKMDGEIIPLGGTYSNGLQYPGDTKGPIYEWINCRCGNVPFIMPDGYMAPPGKAQFREEDLIQTLDYWNQDDLIAQATQEAQTTHFDEERFKAVKTNEELADFFGYEYIPKGRYYEQANIKTFEFYDKKTDTILRFAREGDQKCLNIDFTNNGQCEYDLKDVLRIYDETHPNLKVGLDDITFLRGDKYTPGGDACGCSVRIYDENIAHNFSKRGVHAEVEPLEHTLDHELGHIFSDSFLQENEYNVMDDVAINIRKDFKNAGVNDKLHQQSKGLNPQEVSHYAEKNQSENFAEVTAGVSNLKRGNNYKVYAERVKRPDESKISGFVRDKPTLKEVKSRNPNQYEYVDNLLDHPETVMKNWKSLNQQRVKESRAHFNEFLKQEQNVVRAKRLKNYPIPEMKTNITKSISPKLNKIRLNKKYKPDTTKAVKYNGKTIYGIGESDSDKKAFLNRWGIKKSRLTNSEYKFVILYSGDGDSIINEYYREMSKAVTAHKKRLIKQKYSEKWKYLKFKYKEDYISFDQALKISKTIFKKGMVLNEDIVLVRRQTIPLLDFSKFGIYHSDALLSMSISKNVKPELYGDYLAYIVIPKDTRIFYIERITSESREFEVLFGINKNLKFLKQESEYISHWVLK